MKYRLSGLIIILAGAACACAALVFRQADTTVRVLLWGAAVLFAVCGGVALKRESEKSPDEIPAYAAPPARYAKKEHILTAPEFSLYQILRAQFCPKYEILPQVALVSLVEKLNYTSYRNELFRVVDFVIADERFTPLVVVELNDSSHLRADRRERDRKVAEILEKAGIPLVVLTPEEASSLHAVRRALSRWLH